MARISPRRFHSHRRYIGIALVSAVVATGIRPVRADAPQPEPAALSQLQTVVTNLGYTTTLSKDNQSFSIPWTGNYDYKVHFDLAPDGSIGYAYIDIEDLTPDQLAKLNFVKLLEASDVGNFYFSMESISNGETLYANAIIPLNPSPQLLRTTLQGIDDKLNESSQIWDTSRWK
jgi:hypothetical protein